MHAEQHRYESTQALKAEKGHQCTHGGGEGTMQYGMECSTDNPDRAVVVRSVKLPSQDQDRGMKQKNTNQVRRD